MVAKNQNHQVESPAEEDESSNEKQQSKTPAVKSSAVAAATNKMEKPEPQAVAQAPKEIIVSFAEVSKSVLQQLASEGQILNETAQTRSFINSSIENVEKLKERDPDLKVLPPAPGSQTRNLRVGRAMNLDFTHLSREEHQNIGLSLDINPINVSDTGVELDLSGILRLRAEDGSSLSDQEINANYVFAPKFTLVLVGFLPRQPIRPSDLELFSNTPLVFWGTPAFK